MITGNSVVILALRRVATRLGMFTGLKTRRDGVSTSSYSVVAVKYEEEDESQKPHLQISKTK